MNSVKILTTNIPQIDPYNKKDNISQNTEKIINKTEEKRMALTQRQKSIHFFIDDSLSKLREFIKTPKPYVISKPIRKKMKYIKMIKNKALEKFHISSIKAHSARVTEKDYNKKQFKNQSLSVINKVQNKSKKLTINTDSFFNKFKKEKKVNKSLQNNFKNHLSNKYISNISNIKTDYSSIPTECISKDNYIQKYIYSYKDNKKIYDKSDSLGYNNIYVKEPFYTENGIIKKFMNQIHGLRKDSYKNYYLKLNEFKTNILYENKLSQIQLNNKNHNLTKYYLDKYNNGFNIYWYKLNQELKKETANIDILQYRVKEIKSQINKLSKRIQKRLIKIIDIVIIRGFFEEMKQFCSFKPGTPYYKLLECKTEIIKKMRDYEEETNYIRYILNDKDIGIYSFIEKNKDIFNNKDIKNIIIAQINGVKELPTILNSNIKNLLMIEHYLEKEIESLNYKLIELMKDSKENNYFENLLINEYKYSIKKLAQIKTNNEYLKYKLERIKHLNQNYEYGNLNKNIRLKILQIIKFLNKNKYITDEENNNLNEILKKNKTKYFLECMLIIEKNVNLLKKYEKEIINSNEELNQKYQKFCQLEEAKRKKMKEIKEKMIKKQKIIDKLNKTIYLKENKKDFFNWKKSIYLKKNEKIEKEKKRENNKGKDDIYPAFKAIMKII